MNNLIIPKKDIEKLEKARVYLFELLKDNPVLPKIHFGVSDVMYSITHRLYKKSFQMDNTYKVKVKCTNCEYGNYDKDKIEIQKGQSVKLTCCPECSTCNLIKKEN